MIQRIRYFEKYGIKLLTEFDRGEREEQLLVQDFGRFEKMRVRD